MRRMAPRASARIRKVITVGLAVISIAALSAADAGAASGPVSGGPSGVGLCAGKAAAAQTSPTVVTLKAFGDCEIARRQTTLAALSLAVKSSKGLTSADVSALDGAIGSASAELSTLKANLDSELALIAVKGTIAQIVSKVRVYLVVVPQVRLTIAADDVLTLQPHLTQLSATLADRVAAAKTAGRDVTAAQTALDAMNAALAKAESLAAPWPARLVALTPAAYTAGSGATVIDQARVALVSASAQLKIAVADGKAVLAALA